MPTPRTRAYVLLQSIGNTRSRVIRTLKQQRGVVAVDPVEGPPDVVLVIEASDRPELASLLMRAMPSVEDMTDGLQLLPTQVTRQTRTLRESRN
jgi:hypothetical protein